MSNFNRAWKSRFKKRECEFKQIFLLALPSREYCLYHSQPRILTEAQNPVVYANNLGQIGSILQILNLGQFITAVAPEQIQQSLIQSVEM